jgi:hypothetical protein
MNSKGSRIILVLVVGLTAFSSAMKELNQIRQFGLELNQFVAEWSEKLTPAEIPAPAPAPVVAKVETCQGKQSKPIVELPWLDHVAQTDETADIEELKMAPPPIAKRNQSTKVETLKVNKAHQFDVDPVKFEVRILNDQDGEQHVPAVSDFAMPPSSFKFKTHKYNFIFNKVSPRDREMLKTLNRSISLRIAS